MSVDSLRMNGTSALFHQRRLDLKTLTSAVNAGDTAAAQAALQSYQNDMKATADAGDTSNASRPFATKISADLSNLATAVQAGNMTDAKAALVDYRSDLNGRHRGASMATEKSAFATDLASFLSAAQTGDSSKVQSAATTLTHDLQSMLQTGAGRAARHDHDGDRDDMPAQAPPTSGQAAAPAATTSSDTSTPDPIAADLVNVASALKENDATALQSATAALNKDLQAITSASQSVPHQANAHHHHHHRHDAGAVAPNAPTSSVTPPTTDLPATPPT